MRENTEVPWEEITKGYEYEKDQYVEITDEDLDKADVEHAKTIQIMEFVQGRRNRSRCTSISPTTSNPRKAANEPTA